MSTTLQPDAAPPASASTSRSSRRAARNTSRKAARRIRQNFAACRVHFRWFGTSKTLSPQQKSQAAESFGAEGDSISAGKKLIDTKHEAYRALTSIRSQVNSFWKDNSLPYPEPGIRLIKHDGIEEFNDRLQGYRDQLQEAVRRLGEHYAEIKSAARDRLGSLFDETDYPPSLDDLFAIEWDFPSVDPPDYLQQLNPALYEEQARRVSQQFERAVELAEQAFMEELDRLVNHLTERLAGSEDGNPKMFRDSAIENLNEFFSRFRELNVRSNEQLDDLVNRCQQTIRGIQPQSLRDSDTLRRSIASQLSTVQGSLDQLMIDRPRRNILRPARRGSDQNGERP